MRSTDSRSDLYSLGVVFYQMLTGVLPFTATDPMEWVHCHVARRPAPPRDRVETVPATLSKIVIRLLAKAAEERYQRLDAVLAGMDENSTNAPNSLIEKSEGAAS